MDNFQFRYKHILICEGTADKNVGEQKVSSDFTRIHKIIDLFASVPVLLAVMTSVVT